MYLNHLKKIRMKLIPFKKITNVPTAQDSVIDLLSTMDFIDVAAACILNPVRGQKQNYYTGLSAYMFDAKIKFGFDENYGIESIEFRKPFKFQQVVGLFYKDINLFMPTLSEVKSVMEEKGIPVKAMDVGFEVPEIGLSFFSNQYENDLNVSLDAVTVHF